MLVKKKNRIYSNQRKCIYGSGFISDVGSYILQNKDLLAKPLLGAVGNIGAMALTEGSRYLLNKMVNKPKLDEKSKQIIEELKSGSGIKKF